MNSSKAKFFLQTGIKLFKHSFKHIKQSQKVNILQKLYYFTSNSTLK